MKISYNWLQTYFKKNLFGGALPKPLKLAELFNIHFAEIEGVEKIGGDTIFDIKTLADRNHYALCHRGIAGEAAAILKKPLKGPVKAKIEPDKTVDQVVVKVEDSAMCPRYMARRIDGVKVSESPKWLRNRLESIGARSINNIVDATNFVMFDIGQPIHAFDADKIHGTIMIRKARAGEKVTLLDGREIVLMENDLLIADDLGPLVIAGVKGGKRAEVTADTKSIIIESANFNSTTVRRTSTRANIRNDSSKRFENEITPHLAAEALDHVTALILELSSGCSGSLAKAGVVTDIYPKPVKPWNIKVDYQYMNAVTGLNLGPTEQAEILKRLQCNVEVDDKDLIVTPPPERLDLTVIEDIADEIGRMYGYDKLESKQIPDVGETPIDETFYWSEKVKNILVDLGFSETLLYTLVPKGIFEISYPLAGDKSALRERIAPKIIESLVMNSRNADLLGLETVKIFEIGKVFPKTGEKTSFCIGVSQINKKKGVTAQSILGEIVMAIESKIGVKLGGAIETGPYGALIEVDFDSIAYGLVSDLKAKKLSDLNFVAIFAHKKYLPFSVYPYITRDIALFVPSGISEGEVSTTIKTTAEKVALDLLVKGPDLFDRFEKDGKVSYAFRMIFQSFEKTLSDDEVNLFMTKIYDVVKAKKWEVR